VLELKIEKDIKEETIMQVNGYLRTSMGTPSNLQRRSDHRTIVLALGGIGSGMTTSGTSTGSPGSSSSGSTAVPYAQLRSVLKRSRFSSKGKSTDTIYNVVDHENNPSHYQYQLIS
jgi:hypothetical protein